MREERKVGCAQADARSGRRNRAAHDQRQRQSNGSGSSAHTRRPRAACAPRGNTARPHRRCSHIRRSRTAQRTRAALDATVARSTRADWSALAPPLPHPLCGGTTVTAQGASAHTRSHGHSSTQRCSLTSIGHCTARCRRGTIFDSALGGGQCSISALTEKRSSRERARSMVWLARSLAGLGGLSWAEPTEGSGFALAGALAIRRPASLGMQQSKEEERTLTVYGAIERRATP